jgi:hypothetical protein
MFISAILSVLGLGFVVFSKDDLCVRNIRF